MSDMDGVNAAGRDWYHRVDLTSNFMIHMLRSYFGQYLTTFLNFRIILYIADESNIFARMLNSGKNLIGFMPTLSRQLEFREIKDLQF